VREIVAKMKIRKAGGSWPTFLEWMAGQTVGMYPNGDTNFYTYDVERFISYKCNPANEPVEDFD
jgi:hypothetical protein